MEKHGEKLLDTDKVLDKFFNNIDKTDEELMEDLVAVKAALKLHDIDPLDRADASSNRMATEIVKSTKTLATEFEEYLKQKDGERNAKS